MALALKAENISKQYRLGNVGSGTFVNDLSRWWAKIQGKPDPLLKIGEINKRATRSKSDYVWALKGIDFEVEQGDVLGIIGKNGAGKSTLLKILSKITSPTEGQVKIKGRIASLLEVGTGFHPELTGRENIFLNGAILGMTQKEVKRKFDEIVDFAGVERYIDTPVKRYSSGMYVRLAFAVAAHLENEILIVDEVLAVGDSEFQKKCLGKMGEVSRGEGRTVLFVSHNMGAIKQLCNKAVLLKRGNLQSQGQMSEVLQQYQEYGTADRSLSQDRDLKPLVRKPCLGNLMAKQLIFNKKAYQVGDEFSFELILQNKNPGQPYHGLLIDTAIHDRYDNKLIHLTNRILGHPHITHVEGARYRFLIPALELSPSRYNLFISVRANDEVEDWLADPISFEVVESNRYSLSTPELIKGAFQPKGCFEVLY